MWRVITSCKMNVPVWYPSVQQSMRTSQKRRQSLYAFVGCCHMTFDDSEGDTPIPSFLDEQQCVCMAFYASEYEADMPPTRISIKTPIGLGKDYLFLCPSPPTTRRRNSSMMLVNFVFGLTQVMSWWGFWRGLKAWWNRRVVSHCRRHDKISTFFSLSLL